jgi:formylglycine-generating enzyme required for sulfatase activity
VSARLVIASLAALWLLAATAVAETPLQAQNEVMFHQMETTHSLTPQQMQVIRRIFAASGYVGQGNPAVTQHAATPEQCRAQQAKLSIEYDNPSFEKICGGKYMAPLYDPAKGPATTAKACIDQFEFPDIPCTYPVVWVKAQEAAELCAAEGKRICDAHEWEGACSGELEPPDYDFRLTDGVSPEAGLARMRAVHNRDRAPDKSWSYGPTYQYGICGAASFKSAGCNGGDWQHCGSNTYPTGYFPSCHSTLGVYDLNGNAAEHMNIPLNTAQMSSRGSKELGYTEMKGSWFIFDTYRAHEDWCRWRAPSWHFTRVLDSHSHANYHLGFRCCKTLQ